MPELSEDEHRRLRAVLDRVIPADEDPGALALGTDGYVVAQLAGERAGEADAIIAGLAGLDGLAAARFGQSFERLVEDRQVALLAEIDRQPWFARLVELAAEGFYADPGNGGNRGALSWAMVGYEPRLPPGSGGD